jgi:nucleoside-diphosphate-sugar epimerase
MILITGINGFIAQNLCNLLKNISNDEIIGTTKKDSLNIIEILNNSKPEYIYHCGAEIYNNDEMFDSNILLTYKILEYCRTSTNLKRLIIIGSSSEYGRKNNPMSENDILEPQTIYEGTKSACTMLAQSYSYTYKIPIFIIRPFTIYGPGEKPNKFLQILFKKKHSNDKNISISNGVHDYVYIDDFINAIIEIIKKDEKLFDIINIGSGIQTSNLEVVKIFEKVNNYYFENYLPLESKSYDSTMWVANNAKLSNFYKIKVTLEEGIRIMQDLI